MALEHNQPSVTATQFLTELFDGAEGWVHLFAIDRATGSRNTRWGTADNIAALITSATSLLPTSCIWFGPALRQRNLGSQRGGADECTSITAIWVDIDCAGPNHAAANLPATRADARLLLADFPIEPSVVVDTGGGLQPWWFLDEPLNHNDATAFLTRWGATWAELGRRREWHVDNVFDLARIMRLPATWNRKNDPVRVVVTDWHPDWRYSLDVLDEWTIEAPAAPAQPRHDTPYIGPERPGSALNAIGDSAPLIERFGFVLDHNDTGDRHYRAPHRANERGSVGATVYADGHTTIWSETFAQAHPPIMVKRPYDVFGLYTALMHQGDWTGATTALAALGYGQPNLRFDVAELVPAARPPAETRVRFKRHSVAELLAAETTLTWDSVGLLIADTYGIDGGELKSLKSTFAKARAIGLAAGVPILRHWEVPERKRVLRILGEGSMRADTRDLVRLSDAHSVDLATLDGWLETIYDSAPMDTATFRDALIGHLTDYQPAFVHLDSLYNFHPMTVDSNKLAQVGQMLSEIQHICADHSATLWITAHMNQTGGGFDLKRIVGAGVGEWADSWCLIRHREPPDVDNGRFRLALEVASRQWGAGLYNIDFDIGKFDPVNSTHDGDITFNVQRAGALERTDRSSAKIAEAKLEVLRALRKARKALSIDEIIERTTAGSKTVRTAVNELADANGLVIQQTPNPRPGARGKAAFINLYTPAIHLMGSD